MPPAPDPLTNPYAPPAAAVVPVDEPHASSISDYSGERRSVLLLILLSVVTLGIYPAIWYLRRAAFLGSLDADKRVGVLPWILLVLTVLAGAAGGLNAPEQPLRALQVLAGLTSLVLAFRVAHILRSDFARTGRGDIGVSGAGVFFFGCLYLQHVMNEAAETPGSAPRERKAASSSDQASRA